MKCENLQFDLPLYAENALDENTRLALEAHLAQCPLCRAKLAEFQALRHELLNFSQPAIPKDLLFSVKNSVAAELKRTGKQSVPHVSTGNFKYWLQYRLMPYTVGTVASLLITFFLLFTLLTTRQATQQGVENAQINAKRAVLLASNNNPALANPYYGAEYSLGNLPIGDESPSINPAGALVALTKSIVRGKMKDEEVVVVADVFGDGIARIAEVVEPPSDKRGLENLEKALNEKNSSAPFVPASYDKRAQVVRVIFKIQRVDVVENPTKPNSRNHL